MTIWRKANIRRPASARRVSTARIFMFPPFGASLPLRLQQHVKAQAASRAWRYE
jgi:hypothetical protein